MVDNRSFYAQIADNLADLPTGFPRTGSNVEMEILTRLFPPEDAQLVSKLGLDPVSAKALAAQSGLSVGDVWASLIRLGRRGLIRYTSLGESQFRLQPFGDMVRAQLRKGDPVLGPQVKSYLEELAQSGQHPDFYPDLIRAAQEPQNMVVEPPREPQSVIDRETRTSSQPKRERGVCLSLWLVGVIGGGLLQPIVWAALPGRVPGWMVLWSLLNSVCALALWNWQRWGAWGLGVSFSLMLLLGLGLGDWEIIASAAIPLLLMAFLVGPKQNLLD